MATMYAAYIYTFSLAVQFITKFFLLVVFYLCLTLNFNKGKSCLDVSHGLVKVCLLSLAMLMKMTYL